MSMKISNAVRRALLLSTAGAALVGWVQTGAGSVGRTVFDKLRDWVHVRDFGAVGDGVTDDTAAIRAALASGASAIDFGENATYRVVLTEGEYLAKFTAGHWKLFGANVTIQDESAYTVNGPFTQIFWFDATKSALVEGINYVGPAIENPEVNHGYVGASFVRATSGARNITVHARIENARHGIHSGDYATPALGYCYGFRGHLDCLWVGYSIALYLPRDVEMSIYAEKTHRAAYVAGCHHLRLEAKFKDQYVAPIQVLLTDAKTGEGTSQGCSDCKVSATDMGSTIFTPNSYCAGLALSRVDPGTTFQDIEFETYVKSTDTVATTLGSTFIASDANLIQPSYPYDWEPSIFLRNIRIRGVTDRSQQTVAEHGTGEIYFYTLDSGAHYATVQGLDVSDFQYVPGTGAKPRGFWFFAPGLVGSAKFEDCYFGTETPFYYATNATSSGVFTDCALRGSWSGMSDSPYLSAASFVNCTISRQEYQPFTNKTFLNTKVGGAGAEIKQMMTELTLSGASATWFNALPNNSIILGISGYVTEAITGATGFTVGTAAEPSRFANTNSLAAGTSFSVANATDTLPKVQVGTAHIVVTPKTANFTGGKLRLSASYVTINAPTQ